MTAPPKDLSRHLAPNRVLAAAGIDVKGVLPEVTTCPGCRQEKLAIYLDPLPADPSRWLYCKNCGFKGDSLELYGLVRRIRNLEEAIDRAAADSVFSLDPSDFTAESVASYLTYFPNRRRQFDVLWKQFRANLGQNLHPDLSRRLQEMHLWSTWNYGQNAIGRMLGGALRKEVNDAFEEELLPKTGFRTNLVLNYQDVPGRTSAFQFLGEADRILKTLPIPALPRREGGLAMLDLLNTFEGTVYAVAEPLLALHIQRRHAVDSNEPIKMVVYNDSTATAWESVKADRVILWAMRVDARLFAQARQVRNGYITDHPLLKTCNNDAIYSYVSKFPPNEILNLMSGNAKPWKEFFVEWATHPDRPEHLVRDVVRKLAFTPQERERILDVCPRASRVRIEHFLTVLPETERQIVVNRTTVIERPEGWYAVAGQKKEEVILDTPLQIFREITDVTNSCVYWHGALRHKTKLVEFVEEVEVIERNPVKWLRETMAREGIGMPTFNPGWSKHFTYLVKSFSDPKHVTLTTRMGVQPDGELIFPLFRVKEGTVTEADTYLDAKKTPGIAIKPPVRRDRRPDDQVFPARTAVIAGFISIVYNWLLGLQDSPACPTLFVGPSGSVATAAARHLAKIFTLEKSDLRYTCGRIRTEIKLKVSSFPTLIEPHGYGLLRYFPNPPPAFCFLIAERPEATALATGGSWLRVHAPNLRTDHFNLPPVDDFVLYLMDLQKRSFKLPDSQDLLTAITEDMAAWYQSYLGNQEGLLPALKELLLPPLLPGDALVELVCWIHQAGRFKVSPHELASYIENGSVVEKDSNRGQVRVGVIYGTPEQAVYISHSSLALALAQDRLPTPDSAPITTDLIQRKLLLTDITAPNGWVIKRTHWDKRVSIWKRQ